MKNEEIKEEKKELEKTSETQQEAEVKEEVKNEEAPKEEQKEEAKAEPEKPKKKGIWGHIKSGAKWVYDHRGIVLAGVGFAAGAAVVGTCEYEKGRADQANYMARNNGQQDQPQLPDNNSDEAEEEIEDAEFKEIETIDESQSE